MGHETSCLEIMNYKTQIWYTYRQLKWILKYDEKEHWIQQMEILNAIKRSIKCNERKHQKYGESLQNYRQFSSFISSFVL